MNEEPVYNYIKGQGWVPSNGFSATAKIGKWQVTIEQRRPLLKEHFIEHREPDTSVDKIMGILQGIGYDYAFKSDYCKQYFSRWNKYTERNDYSDSSLFVLRIEKPKPERKPRAPRAPRRRAVEASSPNNILAQIVASVPPVTVPTDVHSVFEAINAAPTPRRSRRRNGR